MQSYRQDLWACQIWRRTRVDRVSLPNRTHHALDELEHRLRRPIVVRVPPIAVTSVAAAWAGEPIAAVSGVGPRLPGVLIAPRALIKILTVVALTLRLRT
jgi:hypothetical protein